MDSFWRQAFPAQIQQDHGGRILDGLIDFKENILEEVSRGRLFNANYPLLIQHIQREAKLYRATVMELLDPSEEELILTADHVLREANHYIRLLETDCDKRNN